MRLNGRASNALVVPLLQRGIRSEDGRSQQDRDGVDDLQHPGESMAQHALRVNGARRQTGSETANRERPTGAIGKLTRGRQT